MRYNIRGTFEEETLNHKKYRAWVSLSKQKQKINLVCISKDISQQGKLLYHIYIDSISLYQELASRTKSFDVPEPSVLIGRCEFF